MLIMLFFVLFCSIALTMKGSIVDDEKIVTKIYAAGEKFACAKAYWVCVCAFAHILQIDSSNIDDNFRATKR